MIAHQEIGWSVLRVIVRRRILVLVSTLVIDIEAEVNVQPSIAVIVGGGCACKRSQRRSGELKGIGLLAKLSAAFVDE